jgi:hypothetical protein
LAGAAGFLDILPVDSGVVNAMYYLQQSPGINHKLE